MNKPMIIIIVLLMLWAAVSCAEVETPTQAAPETAVADQTEAPAPPIATPSPTVYLPTVVSSGIGASQRIQPSDLQYVGAFRLPDGGERPLTFAYGGSAMTFNPDGDPSGASDGFSGSLFVTGHPRLAYGELPDGSQIAEIDIPQPVAGDLAALNQAQFLQGFANIAAGYFTEFEEIPRIGMQYLDHPATGAKIHLNWGQHLEDEPAPTHAWFDPLLTAPGVVGSWFVGDYPMYATNGYLLEIPADWADGVANGRYLGSGRFRDGGWSGMGPSLAAYRPWTDEAGTAAAPGTRLEATTLLLYESSNNSSQFERALIGYQHPDEWEGGAWLTTNGGKTAVLFAGTKSTGDKYWYGFANPAGAEYPCVEEELVGQFELCRLADGTPCPPEDLIECEGHNDFRGWWSTQFNAQFILYDPADLARVAVGELQSWEPQPYAAIDIDEHLLFNPAGMEEEMIGSGPQRHYLIGDLAYDRANGRIYVLELFADEAKPVIHVWQIAE